MTRNSSLSFIVFKCLFLIVTQTLLAVAQCFFYPATPTQAGFSTLRDFLLSMRDQHRPLKHFDLVIDDYLKVVFVKKVDF